MYKLNFIIKYIIVSIVSYTAAKLVTVNITSSETLDSLESKCILNSRLEIANPYEFKELLEERLTREVNRQAYITIGTYTILNSLWCYYRTKEYYYRTKVPHIRYINNKKYIYYTYKYKPVNKYEK